MNQPNVAPERYCASCGHAEKEHTEETITSGYGAGGRCACWDDQTFGGTDECSCKGFTVKGPAPL